MKVLPIRVAYAAVLWVLLSAGCRSVTPDEQVSQAQVPQAAATPVAPATPPPAMPQTAAVPVAQPTSRPAMPQTTAAPVAQPTSPPAMPQAAAPVAPATPPPATPLPATPQAAAAPVAPPTPPPDTPQRASAPAAAATPPAVTPPPAPAAVPARVTPPVASTVATPVARAPNPVTPPVIASPVAAPAAPVTLDLDELKERLRATKAIGLFTKISLKNKVDDLLDQLSGLHGGKTPPTMTELRQSYNLLMMKVLSLLQDKDQTLASTIVSSREVIWGLLADPKTFATLKT